MAILILKKKTVRLETELKLLKETCILILRLSYRVRGQKFCSSFLTIIFRLDKHLDRFFGKGLPLLFYFSANFAFVRTICEAINN